MTNSDSVIKDYDEIRKQKPLVIFGKDVREIKCFRKSFLCGICSGVVGGLASFMMTSKVMFSSNMAFAFLWVGVFGYWVPCRYKYETNLLRIEAMKNKLKTNSANSQSKSSENAS